MKIFKRLIFTLQFFTAIPLPFKLDVNAEDTGKGLVFAPMVGLILGAVLSGAYYILNLLFPIYVTVVLLIVLYIILTGGLHLDGLGDTFDGLFSYRSKERILEIMKDSRVGTNAVLAIVCVLLLDTALLAAAGQSAMVKILLLMPIAGRMGALIGAGVSVYARKGDGLGKSFIDYCGKREVFIGAVPVILIFYAVGGLTGFLLSVVTMTAPYLMVKLLSRKIGGATGDILGAVCEMTQACFLIVIYLLQVLGFKL